MDCKLKCGLRRYKIDINSNINKCSLNLEDVKNIPKQFSLIDKIKFRIKQKYNDCASCADNFSYINT